MTLLLGSLMVPLQTQIESRKVTETQKILDNAREALMGYAAAYGYFPCPADYGDDGGFASGGAETTHTVASGDCLSSGAGRVDGGGATGGALGVYIGYLPAATLGFTPVDASGYAVDAWGGTGTQNRIRYAVSSTTVNGITLPFTRTNGMRTALMSSILSTNLLSVCNTATGATNIACASAATTLTANAIAVVWSLGANATTTGGTSTDEAKNVQTRASANRVFVMRDKSNVTATEFDDMVVWISTPILFSRLLAAGQLP